MTWTPPDQGYPPPPFPYQQQQQQPQPPAAKLSWRLMHSAWILAPILSFGCLGAAGFLYVGIRARRPWWWIPGTALSVLAAVSFFVFGSVKKDSVAQNIFFGIIMLSWLASIVLALVINPRWLRWRAGYQPWYTQQAWTGPAVPAQAPLPPQMQGLVPPPQQFYGAPAVPPVAVAPDAVAPDVVPADVVPEPVQAYAPPIEVNSAGERELAALPGFGPERAARVVAARQARGGVTSVPDFAAAAGLAPHELVAVRDRVTCTPPPQQPAHDQNSPYGRIVDV